VFENDSQIRIIVIEAVTDSISLSRAVKHLESRDFGELSQRRDASRLPMAALSSGLRYVSRAASSVMPHKLFTRPGESCGTLLRQVSVVNRFAHANFGLAAAGHESG